MQGPTELKIDDFEVIEDSLVTPTDLLDPGKDFLTMEKALTAAEFKAACEKTIATCHLAKTKADYRHSFNCFGKPTDENTSLILLNILCANTGNGKNSRKYDLLRRIDYLAKCETDKESALQIESKIQVLKKSIGIEDETIFATIRLTHKEGKHITHSTLHIDKRKLTGIKLCQAMKAAGCIDEFLYQSRPLDDRNALVRVLKIMEQDLLLAFRVLSLVFDLDIHAVDKTDPVVMTFLHGFMWSFVAENISNPGSNLYVLTRQYWESFSRELGTWFLKHSINIKPLDSIRKNMCLFNSDCLDETSPFMWYPEIVIKDLKVVSNALNRLPQSRDSEACSKLNHLLDMFDLQAKNLWLSSTIPEKDAQLLYVNAMLNGFWPLVAQINDAPFAPHFDISEKSPYKDLSSKMHTAFITNLLFRSTNEYILYKTRIQKKVYHEASSDGNYFYPAYFTDEDDPIIKLPFDFWWSCKGFSPTKNDYDTKPDDTTIYVGLSELCLAETGSVSKNIPGASTYRNWLSSLGFPPNPKPHTVAYSDIKSACYIAFYSNLLVPQIVPEAQHSVVFNEHTAIPQAKLLVSKLIEHKNSCSNLAVKKYVNGVIDRYLMKAAVIKHYSMVTFIAAYQKTPQDTERLVQTLCANESTCDAGIMLKKELPLLSSMEWWFALSQIAGTAPKEVKQHIFGFFSAICARERQSEVLEIEPVVPK